MGRGDMAGVHPQNLAGTGGGKGDAPYEMGWSRWRRFWYLRPIFEVHSLCALDEEPSFARYLWSQACAFEKPGWKCPSR
ncbi:hypothetical protein MPNT_60050 [Candidatus Methylacidithermus pantelleriae]|uniref:Uncharacterized protein n=1 Tax=Candidatus Methylacidithermus pantelleriae TaxID=2744239 RepID=A0A8J2BR21_9BACT|nr:hypothetical protein MPNT_60050 [Candidatus Methylacidithermus pantelleriae]